MADTAKTLLLNNNWDIYLTASGNIAVTTGDYATAQNVANAVRLFTDDAYYAPEEGIPHFITDLGAHIDMSVARNRIRNAAVGVEGVAEATVTFDGIAERELTGTVSISMQNGSSADVAF